MWRKRALLNSSADALQQIPPCKEMSLKGTWPLPVCFGCETSLRCVTSRHSLKKNKIIHPVRMGPVAGPRALCAFTCAQAHLCKSSHTCWWYSAGSSWSRRCRSYGCTLHTGPTSPSNPNWESAEKMAFYNTPSWKKDLFFFKQPGVLPGWLEAAAAAGLPEPAASSLLPEIIENS